MKIVKDYYMEDDFICEEQKVYDVTMYKYKNSISSDLNLLLYNNCITHVCTKCKAPTSSKWDMLCNECTQNKALEKYKTLEKVSITDSEFIYSGYLDVYFKLEDMDTLYCALEDLDEETLTSIDYDLLRCHPCIPVHPCEVNLEDLVTDCHEDFELCNLSNYEEISDTISCLNDMLRKEVISYTPNMFKGVVITDEMKSDLASIVQATLIEFNTEAQ